MKVLSKDGQFVSLKPAEEKLLHLLCTEQGASLKQLGKKLRCTPEAVSYRIHQLEERGVIQGYRGVFNLRALGYVSYHVFLRLSAQSEELEKRFMKHPAVNAVLRYSGNRDFEISILARSPEKYDAIAQELFAGIPIQDMDVTMILRTIVSRVMPQQQVADVKIKKHSFTPDATDVVIAEFYSDQAHTPYLEAARQLGMTYDLVRYRVKRMKDAGFFLESRPVINYDSMGYQVYAVLMQFRPQEEGQSLAFEETLRMKGEVLWATKILGKWNYLTYVIVKQDRELHRFIDSLRADFVGVGNVELYPIAEEKKYTFLPKGLL